MGKQRKLYWLIIVILLIPFLSMAGVTIPTGDHLVIGVTEWTNTTNDKLKPGSVSSDDVPGDEECATWEAGTSNIEWQACTGGSTHTDRKCANIDPTNTTDTNWILWPAPQAITITGVDCIVDAATSVVMTLQECDANAANCVDIEAAMTCLATNTTEAGGSVDNGGIDAGDWLRVTRGAVVGTPTQATICWEYY